MDIKFNAIQALAPVKRYQSVQHAPQAASTVVQAADELNVSANGKVFAQAMRQIAETPDVREAKVAELRDRIQGGTYATDSRAIAAKMLGSLRVANG
ncbi:hypothetical protein FACS1894202_09960 [Clostridia bacterium]|nr:hypothetical protein FACS1894202_09960 [Clostridia bacterium]